MRRILLNPGPVTISDEVRNSLMRPDNCHREKDICNIIQSIRKDLVNLSGGGKEYTTTLFASSGTGALEAVMGTLVAPKQTKRFDADQILIIGNGDYGYRLKQIANVLNIPSVLHSQKWGAPIDVPFVRKALQPGDYSHVFMVHHETTTGILNPVKEIGEYVKDCGSSFVVDAISSFGGIPFNIEDNNIDFLITSANKCIQGVPGISIVIGKQKQIEESQYFARSLYFNLCEEWKHQEETGMFRFTSPVQVIYALQQALSELKIETISGRYKRYCKNYDTMVNGFCNDFGFELFPTETPSKLLATFMQPKYFDFKRFHDKLYQRSYVVYPGKIKNTFRVAVMGDIDERDIKHFLTATSEVLKEMKR